MADNTTSLNIEVKTSGVNQAASDLQKLSGAAASTEKSTSSMASGINAVNAQLAAMAQKAQGAGNSFKALDPAAQNMAKLAREAKEAERAIASAAKEIDKAAKASDGFGTSAANVAKGGLAAAALVKAWDLVAGSIGDAIKAADDYTRIESRLRQVAGGASAASDVQNALYRVAQETRQPFIELANTYAQVARATEELNLGQTRLIGISKTVSQAVALSGSTTQGANAAMIQFSQAMAAGVLRGEELNSIMEQTPRLAQAIAQGMGVGIGELRRLGQEGALTAEKVLGALEKAAGRIESEFKSMTPTVADGFTKLSNSAKNFIDVLNDATGASKLLYKTLAGLSSVMDFTAKGVKAGVSNAQNGVLEAKVASLQNQLAGMAANDFRRAGVQKQLESAQGDLFKARGNQLAGGAEMPVLPGSGNVKQTQAEIELWNKLNGISGSYAKELKVLNDQYTSGKIGVDEYRKSVSKLIELEVKGPSKSRGGSGRVARSDLNAGEDTATAKAYASAIEAIEKAQRAADKSGLDLTASQSILFDLMKSPEWARMPDAWKAVVKEQQAAAQSAEELAKFNQAVKAQVELNDRAYQQSLDRIAALEEENNLYGLSSSQITQVNISREEEAIALARSNGAYEEHIAFLEKDLELKKQLANVQEKNDVKRLIANTDTEIAKRKDADRATLDRAKSSGEITDKVYQEALQKLEQTGKAVTELDEFTKQAARNMTDAMADFFIDPTKKGMESLLSSFGQMLQKMIAQAAAAQIGKYMFGDLSNGGFGGAVGSGLSWVKGLFSPSASSTASFVPYTWANGGAFGNGFHAFASGGAFGAGEVLTSPTFFKFASGGSFRKGVAGEAGPEAALPLKRMSNGKLGVYMAGGGGMNITQNINVGGGSDPREVKRAAAQGARSVLAISNGARRYG